MSEELLSNDRRLEKHLTPPGFESVPSPFIIKCTTDFAIWRLILLCCNLIYIRNKSESKRDHSKMKNESVKKSLEKSKKVLEEERKTVQRKVCLKKDQHVYYNCYELRSRAIKQQNWPYG